MLSVPRINVSFLLIITILGAILLSWVLGAGIANYLAYRDMRTLYRQMVAQSEHYPVPIAEPHFTVRSFFLGVARPRLEPGPYGPAGQPQRPQGMRPMPPDPTGPRRDDHRPPPPRQGRPGMYQNPPQPQPGPPGQQPLPPIAGWRSPVVMFFARISIAVLLACLVGYWIGRRFTRPLRTLAQGAQAYAAGKLAHRVTVDGEDEFAQVATAMNRMAERLAAQMQQLRDDADRRQRMLANVAHELRSPVMTMRTMAGALAEGLANDPERQARAMASMVRTSDRLLHLVNDVLDLARLDLHELPIHPQVFDLREVLEQAMETAMPHAERAGITIRAQLGEVPVLVQADPIRLGQVVDNLVLNAISYAGAGATVSIRVQAGTSVRLLVADTGRGISAQHLPFIFDPFYRVDDVRTPGEPHAGLGLRISRSLVEAQGGTLLLESVEGRGTVATVTLPGAAAQSGVGETVKC